MEDTPKYCKKQKHYLLHSINALYLEILPGSVGGGGGKIEKGSGKMCERLLHSLV